MTVSVRIVDRKAARIGFAAALAAHGAILHWIYVVTVVYGHAPVLVGVLAVPLMFRVAMCWIGRRPLAWLAAGLTAFAPGCRREGPRWGTVPFDHGPTPGSETRFEP